MHIDDEDDEPEGQPPPEEPEEGDLVTDDHRRFFTVGESWTWPMRLAKPDLVVAEGESMDAALRAYMDREQYWPGVWFVSDHGDVIPIVLDDVEDKSV